MALRAKDPNDPKGEIELAMEKEGWTATRWWRAIGPDGTLMAESSNPDEFDKFSFPLGTTIQHMYRKEEFNWITENPK